MLRKHFFVFMIWKSWFFVFFMLWQLLVWALLARVFHPRGAAAVDRLVVAPAVLVKLLLRFVVLGVEAGVPHGHHDNIAVGAVIPDRSQSVTVARRGYGSMAVSNSTGSQIINILIGLGLPWLISTMASVPVPVHRPAQILQLAAFQGANVFLSLSLAPSAPRQPRRRCSGKDVERAGSFICSSLSTVVHLAPLSFPTGRPSERALIIPPAPIISWQGLVLHTHAPIHFKKLNFQTARTDQNISLIIHVCHVYLGIPVGYVIPEILADWLDRKNHKHIVFIVLKKSKRKTKEF